MSFADQAKLKADGRNFDCATCPESIQKIRRCKESREDFTEKDGAIWPMYIQAGGDLYSFCPAKATWSAEITERFRLLMLSAETGVMMNQGGIADQPDWFIDSLFWFVPRYNSVKFYSRAASILGDDKKKSSNLLKGQRKNGRNK